MKLESHELLVVDVPLERRWMGVTDLRHVILRLRSDEGTEGIGWAFALDPRLIATLRTATDALTEPLIGRDPRELGALHRETAARVAYWGPGLTRFAEAIIDVALHDLVARASDVSVARLLGASARTTTVPVYASQHLWRDWDLNELESGAAALADEGWRAMKFRIGANRLAGDEAERAKVVRAAVGDDITLMVDVNQGWDVARTKEVAPLLEPARLAWLEDPIDHRDVDGYRRLVGEIGIPITHGEYHCDTEPFARIAAARAADTVMIDAHHVGGIINWQQAASYCAAGHLPVATHLSPEIGVHLAAATPNCQMLEYMDWSVNLFVERIELDEEGRAVVPDRPGLGFTLDEELVTARQVD